MRPLSAVAWTPDLAGALATASAGLAALNARVSASSVGSAWRLRASWQGYAKALSLNNIEMDEIDIIAAHCGIRLTNRKPLPTTDNPLDDFPTWAAQMMERSGRHWRENLPFTFDAPLGWNEAPSLVRALTLLDHWVRVDRSKAPWLALPTILGRMDLTTSSLPCLVAGDPGQRVLQGPRPALLKRLLKQLTRASQEGLVRLDRLEEIVQRSAAVIAGEHRPGQLAALGRLALSAPCLAARNVSPILNLTISGAGKLLTRANRLGLLVEVSGRETWRTYVAPDVGIALGLVTKPRGRPLAPPSPSTGLDAILAAFDAEMAAIDERLSNLHQTDDLPANQAGSLAVIRPT